MEVEDVFTKGEVARRSYEKAEKFRHNQAAIMMTEDEKIYYSTIRQGRKCPAPYRNNILVMKIHVY